MFFWVGRASFRTSTVATTPKGAGLLGLQALLLLALLPLGCGKERRVPLGVSLNKRRPAADGGRSGAISGAELRALLLLASA